MSIYQPLADFLAARKGDLWEASFADVESTLGRALPQSAYRHQAWWANQTGAGHSQTYGWRSAGWRTTRLNLEGRRVTFERERDISSSTPDTLDALIETAGRLLGLTDREDIVAKALRTLIAHEALTSLGELGGSMPDYHAPNRERP